MQRRAATTSITELPDELVLTIFSYLDLKDLLSVSCVCSSLFLISLDDHLWKKLIKHRWPNMFPKLFPHSQSLEQYSDSLPIGVICHKELLQSSIFRALHPTRSAWKQRYMKGMSLYLFNLCSQYVHLAKQWGEFAPTLFTRSRIPFNLDLCANYLNRKRVGPSPLSYLRFLPLKGDSVTRINIWQDLRDLIIKPA